MSGQAFKALDRYTWEGDEYYSPLIHADFADQTRYFLYDGLGSTRQLLDDSQDITDSYQYEAFGNVLSDGAPTPNPYRYVGSLGYYQTGSSLQHLGARYYLPEPGRFLQSDPLGDPHAGPYCYVEDNPLSRIDPTGRSCTVVKWCHTTGYLLRKWPGLCPVYSNVFPAETWPVIVRWVPGTWHYWEWWEECSLVEVCYPCKLPARTLATWTEHHTHGPECYPDVPV